MKKQDILILLDELLELPAGTLKGDESLEDWDSIIIIGFIALADEKFNKRVTVANIQSVFTINDLINNYLS